MMMMSVAVLRRASRRTLASSGTSWKTKAEDYAYKGMAMGLATDFDDILDLEKAYSRRGPRPSDRVCIVGAGPAGIHMAHILHQEHNIKNITVFENEARTCGKSLTLEADGVVQEMGTCYTVPYKYWCLRRLLADNDQFKEVAVPPRAVSNSWSDTKWIGQEEWLMEPVKKRFPYKYLPGIFTRLSLFLTMVRYKIHHRRLFKLPKQEFLKRTNKTFKQYLDDNGFSDLEPLFSLAMTIQGYGYVDRVSAFYGLWWNSGPEMQGFIDAGLFSWADPSKQPASLLVEGFEQVFKYLAEPFKDQIKTGYNIKKITRNNGKIQVYEDSPERNEPLEFDFLIISTPLKTTFELIEDAPDEHVELAKNMTCSNLTTTLFSCKKKKDMTTALWTWVDGIKRDYSGHVMTVRSTYRVFHKGKPPRTEREHFVSYQYMEDGQVNPTKERKQELLDKLHQDLAKAGFEDIQVVEQKVWPYFHQWSQEEITAGKPLKVLDIQGLHNTWYIGASLLFESVHDVVHYNEMLVKGTNFIDVASP
eukprot:TRINITY_DN25250_c0_g1_i1.p1 TRINITY_DN25250_c0_g1~~TRINITY_DN25250_c0_g1_i1.p1  ORF type:complete len:531 (-),score=130.16 TRINITY_DN25250_c0_g1_i1:64-1656(-)